jgi:hypothetical protein
MKRASIQQSIAVIGLAVLSGLVVWGLFRVLDVEMTTGKGDDASAVGFGDVFVAAVVGGLAAWGVHTVLSRQARTTRWWPFVASTALAISMIGPNWMADGGSAVALMCLHFAVGVVLIAGFAKIGPDYCPAPRSEPRYS